jgi:hypothetical protein
MTWWMTVCKLVLALACIGAGTVLVLNGHWITGPFLLLCALLAASDNEQS